jgi:hypothetical protein
MKSDSKSSSNSPEQMAVERLKPACRRIGFTKYLALAEAARGNLQIVQIGRCFYVPRGSIERLLADRLAGKRD